jgi:myo-inositol-1(or 4)-monophosphatase
MKQLEGYKELAIKAAHIGGKILLKHFEKISEYDLKKGAGIVTKADTESEKAISEFFRKRTPQFGIFAEEEGYKYKGESRWIIDPLDGTTNFFHRVPHFNISIALEMDKEIVVGVVYNPVTDEMYNCRKGGGAYRDKKRIHVTSTKKLSTAMLATGFAYMSEKKMKAALDLFLKFSLNCHGIRRFGAAALDACYVAEGIYDGFYERTLSPWDVAAGGLLVMEAGGKLSNYSGGKFSIYDKEIVASNGLIHKEMINLIQD